MQRLLGVCVCGHVHGVVPAFAACCMSAADTPPASCAAGALAAWVVGPVPRAAATAAATSGGSGRDCGAPLLGCIRSKPATCGDVMNDRSECRCDGARVVQGDGKAGHACTDCRAAGHGCCISSAHSLLQLPLDMMWWCKVDTRDCYDDHNCFISVSSRSTSVSEPRLARALALCTCHTWHCPGVAAYHIGSHLDDSDHPPQPARNSAIIAPST